jgi:cardiolipin synthase
VPNIPTVITIIRLLLAPVVGYLIAQGRYGAAAAVFVAAAVSDLADGAIARRFALVSELGARLDAVADKVLMVIAALALAWQGLLPVWLVAAIVVRDAIVLCGAVAYRCVVGQVEMAPTLLSKINTGFAFAVVSAVMADAAAIIDLAAWLPALFMGLFATIVMSGAQYVWVWGRKAISARRVRTG